MMVFCQTHSAKLRILHADGTVVTLHYDTRAARNSDKEWYIRHGFKVK